MATIELAAGVLDDFDRFFDHMTLHGVEDQVARIAQIVNALQVLEQNPLIGRKVIGGRRELVIGRGARGYVALYQFVPELEIVFVLAIKAQREAGYASRGE